MTSLQREPRIARPNQPNLVQELRKLAQTNPAFNAIAHVFAIRERARQQVTVNSLTLRMLSEGYTFSVKEYIEVLRSLANLGIGTLEFDMKTKEVKSLKNIKLTLQSIGKAAIGVADKTDNFTPQYDYKELPMNMITPKPATAAPTNATPPPKSGLVHPVSIMVTIDGKPVSFPLPRGLTTQEVGELLAACYVSRPNN